MIWSFAAPVSMPLATQVLLQSRTASFYQYDALLHLVTAGTADPSMVKTFHSKHPLHMKHL